MKGHCACGQVSVTLARKPEYVNFCNCSLCRPLGGAWGYSPLDEVEIEGQTSEFGRTDIERCLTEHLCPGRGAAIAWTPYGPNDRDRLGVNMWLFALNELTGIPAVWSDGLNMSVDMGAPVTRTGHGTMGEGKAF